uniref:DNA-damage-inducible protein J n=2 Tax=unclassified Candidatus Kentrum TaxID=2643149 RepID=A0A451B5R7_9GAMM|nr:MAG: DNA-damage-inducible protein J [Candidatus Kentron sp. LPFa]VFK68516.1 MAG: DNA-damage-inducible protein J [Candidatus Kentron sp. UNK]VFK73616.1 MAG: DNA-damage-inducible protein J [Candidatus Kentron sp. UNK]
MGARSGHVQSKVEPELKKSAEDILSQIGLSMSDALRIFLKQVVFQRGLPFDLRLPNHETIQAIEDVKMGENFQEFSTKEELFEEWDRSLGRLSEPAPIREH